MGRQSCILSTSIGFEVRHPAFILTAIKSQITGFNFLSQNCLISKMETTVCTSWNIGG